MICEHLTIGGNPVIVCRSGRRQTCKFCRIQPVAKLCDFPVGLRGKTCDAGMCAKCATSVGHDLDYCPTHKDQKPSVVQGSLFLEAQR